MAEAAQKFIPGAPPPAPLSKSQRKRKAKTKTTEETAEPHVVIPDAKSAALVEEAPEKTDIQEGTVSSELIAQPESVVGDGAKLSPIVDLVTKRLKVVSKKIVRAKATVFAARFQILNYCVADQDIYLCYL